MKKPRHGQFSYQANNDMPSKKMSIQKDTTHDQKYAIDRVIRNIGTATRGTYIVSCNGYEAEDDTVDKLEHIPKHLKVRC